MAPRSITSITIPLLSHNVPDRDIICWEALDRLEKGSGWERFGNLSELIIAFTPNCGCAQLSEYYVSSKLPDLASRGLLKFISPGVFAGQPDENLPVQSYDRDDRLPFHAWQRHRAAGRHILMNYANQHLTTRNGRIQVIPQGVFPTSQTYTPLPNVTFTVSGALGIRLVDALNPAFHGLCDAGVVPRMTKDAKKFILRLKWPGYPAWSEVVHAYDHTYMANPNTLKKVAQLAAQKIQMFCHELHRHPYDVSSGGDGWQIERHPLETLVLLELRHVSQGSWQPVLACL
ncbi:hypothetical protein BC629DRAFT_1509756 [Irpex lacteus]|nr:hypothetical protein BC629DRAFT_1509756 [Irpex lacteus]